MLHTLDLSGIISQSHTVAMLLCLVYKHNVSFKQTNYLPLIKSSHF
jgi:hypothetical protein